MGIRLATLPQALLEDMLLRHAHPFKFVWRQSEIRFLPGPGHRCLIDGFDILLDWHEWRL
jgi:hypothetical protein